MEQRYAASAVIFNEQGKVLLAKRATTKHPYPGAWSLPSTYIKTSGGVYVNELLPISQIKRQLFGAVRKKLRLDISLPKTLGQMQGQQADYHLTMIDFIGEITDGQPNPNQVDFSEADFYDPFEKLGENPKGFCAQILITKLKEDRDFWKSL